MDRARGAHTPGIIASVRLRHNRVRAPFGQFGPAGRAHSESFGTILLPYVREIARGTVYHEGLTMISPDGLRSVPSTPKQDQLLKPVALNDLLRQTVSLQAELSGSLNRVLNSGWYILGRECAAFEEEFAAYCGVPHCVSVANGTEALELALRALGVGPGDTVATVANAGGYSTTAIRAAGATPLYIDIEADSMNMSAGALAAGLTHEVRAVIATHLYGRMADLPALLEVTERHRLPLIED